MSVDRREFLRRVAIASGGLGVRGVQATERESPSTMPTPRTRAMMSAFGLRFPIFCAGMGTVATPELAIAVSSAGGLGALGTGSRALAADVVRDWAQRIRSATDRPFAVNYLLAFDSATLPAALDAGAPIIQVAWGIPSAETVAIDSERGRQAGSSGRQCCRCPASPRRWSELFDLPGYRSRRTCAGYVRTLRRTPRCDSGSEDRACASCGRNRNRITYSPRWRVWRIDGHALRGDQGGRCPL
jgi:hypothetical protein